MIKILGYKYPTSTDVIMNRQVPPQNFTAQKETIKSTINKLLFVDKYNYVLIGLDGKLFICETADAKTKTYSRREISYHPHENLVL